ncbi:MAG: IS200/IS605 family transposase [Acidobacteriia bacterium]|nr:IS200/IS605 family transposase [Terriglobia bacterium]
MPNSYTSLRYHVTFSTKNRFPLIPEDWRTDLYRYIGGIIRGQQGKLLEIGGRSDHLHLLFSMRADQALSEILRQIKSDSSKWIHCRWVERRGFHWQRGFGGFTVSRSAEDQIAAYIRNQKSHHRKMTFQEEFIKLLKAHEIDYDERYIWI